MLTPLDKLTPEQANAPRPEKPDSLDPVAWENYYADLACWKATQAEKLLSGVEDVKG